MPHPLQSWAPWSLYWTTFWFLISKQVSTTTNIVANLPDLWTSKNLQATIPVDSSVSAACPEMVLREGTTLRNHELTVFLITQYGFEEVWSRIFYKPSHCRFTAGLECIVDCKSLMNPPNPYLRSTTVLFDYHLGSFYRSLQASGLFLNCHIEQLSKHSGVWKSGHFLLLTHFLYMQEIALYGLVTNPPWLSELHSFTLINWQIKFILMPWQDTAFDGNLMT